MPPPVALALTLQIWYQKLINCGSPVGCLELHGVGGETMYFMSGKNPVSPSPVI